MPYHIFTGDHVPPFLARSYLPFPFYLLVLVNIIVPLFRFYYNVSAPALYNPFLKRVIRVRTFIARILTSLGIISTLVGYWLTALVIVYANLRE